MTRCRCTVRSGSSTTSRTAFADARRRRVARVDRPVGWRHRAALLRGAGRRRRRLGDDRRAGSATSAGSRSTTPTRTRAWPAPCSSTGCEPRAIHSMRGAGDTVDAAAAAYDAAASRAAPPIDLVHLGLGPDGHTASLFPGSPALAVDDRLVVHQPATTLHPHPRLTFTYPALARSRARGVHRRGRRQARRVRPRPRRRRPPRGARRRRTRDLARRPCGARLTRHRHGGPAMELWELVARERSATASPVQRQRDSGRIDEMVGVFAPDGVMERAAVATWAATRSTRSCRRSSSAVAPTRRDDQRVGGAHPDRGVDRAGRVPFIRHTPRPPRSSAQRDAGQGAVVLPVPDRARPRPLGPYLDEFAPSTGSG